MLVDDCGNYPTPISIFGTVLSGYLEGMGKYIGKSTKGMSLTLQQAKKIARKMGHTQSARSIMRGREDDIAESLRLSKSLKNVAKWTGRALLVFDIGSSWINNYNSGSNTWVTDSIVDTGYSLLKYGVGALIFTGCMAIPVVGWIIGIGACIAIEIGLDIWMADKMDDIKNWAADVGGSIEKGWNQFWSFNWI